MTEEILQRAGEELFGPSGVVGTVTDTGEFTTILAPDANIRTDFPLYRVWVDDELTAEIPDATQYWRDDLVAFHIGCSFTFEHPLVAAEIQLRHVEQNRNAPMYITNRECRSAGRVSGPTVVSMRPFAITHAPGHMLVTDVPDSEYTLDLT